jgi:hypothetical protein
VREEERELFISLFGDYILLTLYVYAISKKYLKTKRKTLFGLRFFYLSQGEEKGERMNKQRKSNTLTGQIVIYLVRVLPERESIVFANRGKTSLFYKKQYNK